MALDSFIEKIPEGDREAFKAEIANAVIISDAATAKELLTKHPILSSARDSFVTEAVKTYDKNFNETKLAGLLEAEYKKRHPDADPKDLAYKALEEKLNNITRDGTLKERKAAALTKLAELGLPVSLADLALDLDEPQFNAKLELLTGLKTWKEEAVSKALAEKLGNQGNPKGGTPPSVDFSKMSITEVMEYAKKGPAEMAQVLEFQKRK